MKGVKMKLNMDIVNCVLLVVILALVIYCVVKQNEGFSYVPPTEHTFEEDTGGFEAVTRPAGGTGRQNATTYNPVNNFIPPPTPTPT
jgi:hypothetical protein